jgi:peptide/nickel transport system substrate-binding protein
MLSSKKMMLVIGLLIIASMALAACQPSTTATPNTVVETVVVTVETSGEPVVQVVTPTPEPVAAPDTLVICEGQEPSSFYWFNSELASSQLLEAIYDGDAGGGIDNRTYAYQPIILEKLPSLADGDATLTTVTAHEGDTVVDFDSTVITLDGTAGQMLRVPGSADPTPYTGGDVELEQLSATFKILPGMMWSDGTPLTAADSVYGFKLAADPDTPTSSRFSIDRTASYEATDDQTAVWTGLPGFYDSTYFINWQAPFPEHIWGQYTAAELEAAVNADVANMLIGYGPYKAVEWNKGDNFRLVKNENYFRASEGLPKFDNVVYRFVGANSNANIAAILAGECDIVDQTSSLDDQSELLLELQAAGQLDATFVTGTTWEHVDYGIQNVSYDDGYNPATDRYDFFSDLKVRQGLLMCMDRQAVVDTVTFGQSVVIDTYLPPNHPLYNADVTKYPYDPEAGKALLAEAGWTDTDGDGILDNGAGQNLAVNYETTTATYRAQVTQIIADSLKGCGVDVTLNYYPSSDWFADWPDGKLFGRNFDLGEFAWLTGVEPPCDLYLSSQITGNVGDEWISIMDGQTRTNTAGAGGSNDTGFANADYDTACKAALSSLPGQPEYEANHKLAQKIFSDQLPVAPLFLRLKLAATRADMCNFFMDPTANSEFWDIEEFGYGSLCN